jgi:hypothetical protein
MHSDDQASLLFKDENNIMGFGGEDLIAPSELVALMNETNSKKEKTIEKMNKRQNEIYDRIRK